MRIKHLHIYGFGKLTNFELDLNDQLQVIYGENEAGKSTIFAFIQAMLFGFPIKSASSQSFEPVHAMTYGGSLVIEKEDKSTITIERVKKKTGSEVKLIYMDGQLGDEEDLRQLTAGIDRSFFERIYAFDLSGLADVSKLNEDELGKFLFYTGISGSDSLFQVETQLAKKMDELYKPGGSKPTINVDLKQLQECQKALKEAQENEATYNHLISVRDEMALQLAKHKMEMEKLQTTLLKKKEQKRLLPLIKERNALQAEVVGETAQHVQVLKGLGTVLDRIEAAEDEVQALQTEVGYLDKQIHQIKQDLAIALPDEAVSGLDTGLFVRDQIRQLENEKQLYLKQVEDCEQQQRLHHDRLEQLEKQKVQLAQFEPDENRNKLPGRVIFWIIAAVLAIAAGLFYWMGQNQVGLFAAIGAILLGVNSLFIKDKQAGQLSNLDTEQLKLDLALENEKRNMEKAQERQAELEANLSSNENQLMALGKQLQLPEQIALNMLSLAFEKIEQWKKLVIDRSLLREKVMNKQEWIKEKKEEIQHFAVICKLPFSENLKETVSQLVHVAEQSERLFIIHTQIGDVEFPESNETEIESAIASITEELAQLDQALSAAQTIHSEAQVKIQQLEQAGTVEMKHYDYQAKLDQFQTDVQEWMKLAIAKGILEQTIRVNKEEKLPQILAKAEQYLAFLTDSRYQKIIFDELDQVLLLGTNQGELIQAKDISRGTAELVYAVIRLAFAEHLDQQQIWPIVMDDAFVNFDEKRTQRMLELLKTIGKTQQVIFFTCHQHLLTFFSKENVVQLGEKEFIGGSLL